jgi:nucleoside-diphosphate-sugar epimerase
MVFVTGATGFLGSYVCLYLIEKGYKIKASKRVDSIIPSFLEKHADDIEWLDLDLHDFFEVEDAIQNCEAIFHCAAKVSFNKADKKMLWKTNVELTHNLVNVSLEHPNIHFIHVSSIAAIGDAKLGAQIDENCRWIHKKTSSDYAISKFEAEREVWRGIHEGLNAVIINPSVILGFDEREVGSMKFIHQINKGLKFYTSGSTGFVDVNDVATCMLHLFEQKITGQRYIVNAENKTYKELFEIIAKLLNKKAPSIYIKKSLLMFFIRLINLFYAKLPLNKYTVRAAYNTSNYSNHKITSLLPINFMPVEKSIQNMLNKKLS